MIKIVVYFWSNYGFEIFIQRDDILWTSRGNDGKMFFEFIQRSKWIANEW